MNNQMPLHSVQYDNNIIIHKDMAIERFRVNWKIITLVTVSKFQNIRCNVEIFFLDFVNTVIAFNRIYTL